MTTPDATLYTYDQISQMLGLTDDQNRTVKRLVDQGELRAIEISARIKRVSPVDWARFLESKKTNERSFTRRGRRPSLP